LESNPGRSLKLNKRLYVVLICFLISTVFWLLMNLSHQYTTSLSFPVSYSNVPGKKVVINDLPAEITVQLRTSGFKILSYDFDKHQDTIRIDVGSKLENATYSSMVLSLPTKSFMNDFSNELGKEADIIGFLPDSIVINFTDRISKTVPVKLAMNISFEKQFDTSGTPVLTPSAVEVSGPPSILAELTEINTETVTHKDLRSPVKKKVSLAKNKLLTYNISEVQYTIPVEKFTEGIVEVPLHPVNVSTGYSLKTFPEKIKIRFLVALSKYNRVTAPMFDAVVDASDLEDQRPGKLPVDLMTSPSFIKSVSLEPEKVDYILRKE
jgi:YbbR domain-containing protein